MKFLQLLAPAAGLMSLANAWETDINTVYTTVVTTAYETYCPSPTTFIHHNVTYTATSATTLTITNCPCTITTHKPPPYTTTKTFHPPPPVNTTSTYCPPESTTKPPHTPKPPKPSYHNTTSVEHTPKPPKPSHTDKPGHPPHHNGTSTTVIIVTPPAETSLGGVTPVTPTPSGHDSTPPSKTPVAPSTTRPVTVPGSAADKVGAGVGAVLVAGLFVLLI